MAYQWFRMYAEFAHDPKVQTMSREDQRHLVMLFCVQSENNNETLQDCEVMYALSLHETEMKQIKERFIEKRFVSSDWKVKNWNKRQYRSDSSTERVREWREKQRNVSETLLQQSETVTVTVPDSEQIRTEHKKPLRISAFKGESQNPLPKKKLCAECKKELATVNTRGGICLNCM